MRIQKPNILFGNNNFIFTNSINNVFNIKNYLNVKKFKNGELNLTIKKFFFKEKFFFFQSLYKPKHENFLKLLLILDIIKRNFKKKIYLIIPYFCYSRQDKIFDKNSPISIKTIINAIEFYSIKKILSIDAHSNNFESFFNTSIKVLNSTILIVNDIIKNNNNVEVIVSPDIGGILRSKNLANYLNLELIIVDKRRPLVNNVKIFCMIGNVTKKHCIIIDDIIDTGCSIINVTNYLIYNKSNTVKAYITHAVFSNNSYLNIIYSKINQLIITDTIKFFINSNKIRIISTKYTFIEEIKKILLLE